jgi:23S rRNA (cytidine2498-2'-O)-methyltransferase
MMTMSVGVGADQRLRELHAADSPLSRYAPGFLVRHLYHDREEFTVVGVVQARA